MFNFFKAKEKNTFHAPCSGKLVKITEIDDPVFSSKMLGDGYGVQPTAEEIFSPVYGTVTSIFPTKHAIGIQTDSGDEVLLHIGIDTVELGGKPFEIFVQAGDTVSPKTMIATANLEMLEEFGKRSTMIVVYTNHSKMEAFDILETMDVTAGEKLGKTSE